MGYVSRLMKSHNVSITRGLKASHRSQGIVERFNGTLAEKLFGHQYAQEILSEARLVATAAAGSAGSSDKRSREWVSRLPYVICELNKQPTRLIGGKTPLETIKLPEVKQVSSSKCRPEKLLPRGVKVRYLYLPGELEGGEHCRATDPIWSLDTYKIRQIFGSDPIVYYLHDSANSRAPKRGFVREELLVVPLNTELPPEKNILVNIMDKWNTITKEVKKFLDEYPEAPFDVKIDNKSENHVKVSMSIYLQPERGDQVDGIGLELKKAFTL